MVAWEVGTKVGVGVAATVGGGRVEVAMIGEKEMGVDVEEMERGEV